MKKIIATILMAVTAVFCATYALGLYGTKEAVPTNGLIEFQNKTSYEGGLLGGRFDGKGIFTYQGENPNQSWSFEGFFENGQVLNGTFYFVDGRTFAYERGANAELDFLEEFESIILTERE